ncbi:hypothetical protein MTO96_017165 [Rhipicephalus appendiculatus]
MNAAAVSSKDLVGRPTDQERSSRGGALCCCCSRRTRVLVRKDSPLSVSPVDEIVLTASPGTAAGPCSQCRMPVMAVVTA